MKLTRLDLKAFGPFTDRTLDFTSVLPGLHIIYGPNEAGKSSSLRALKALLFGFEQQTPDNFLHSYDQLLVCGRLENSNGQILSFQRRKKRIDDILDENGNPLSPNSLAPFLHGVDPEIFESLYGITHDILIRGGEEILAQKGEVGQALFAAGAGISSLREVIEELETEAAELFKPLGKVLKINSSIKRYKELLKEAKIASLSCKDWKDQQKTLHRAEQERRALEVERDQKNKELRRLERLRQAIPELASLRSWQLQLQALGDVTPLPLDFEQRHQQAIQAIREAGIQLKRDTERLEHLEKKREAITFHSSLVDQAPRVDDFHQRLGEYRKGLKDRPERNGMRISLRREAAHLLQQIRPDLTLEELPPLRAVLAKKKTIQRLSGEYEAINQQLLQAENQQRNALQEHEDAEQALATMPMAPDAQGLLQAVKMAHRKGNIDSQLASNRHEIEQGEKECQVELKRVGLWSGEMEDLMGLSLPLPETIQQFDKRYSELAEKRRGEEKEREIATQELDKTLSEIKKITYTTDIPSEEELYKSREKRELGWQLVRRHWLDHEDVTEECLAYDRNQPLSEAYEYYVNQVDFLADRLRREADRVAGAAALRAQVETQQKILANLDRRRETLALQQKELDEDWSSIWREQGVRPLSPREMNGWLVAIDRLRYKAGEIMRKEQQTERDLQEQQHLRLALQKELQVLNRPLPFTGNSLGPAVAFAETVLEELAFLQAQIKAGKDRLESATRGRRQASENQQAAQAILAKWQAQWSETLAGLGLGSGISTTEALDLLDTLQSCFDKIKEAEDLQKRIDGIDRDAKELGNELKTLLVEIAPDLLQLPLDQAILQLQSLLKENQRSSTLHAKLSEEVDLLRSEVSVAEKILQIANEQLDELLQTAKSNKPEELTEKIRLFAEHKRLQDKISDSKANLAKIGAGIEVSELIRQATEVNADELPGQIEAHRQDIEKRIHPEINRVSQIIGEQTTILATMDGNDKAAEIAEKMEQELTRLRRLTERYTKVKLASKILQLEIERYREEHQDPVLKIASNYFRLVTLDSFSGLRTDVDDKGEPVLIGIRPGGRRVTVQGMSSGTRDQLYLALRLATLEWRLESQEPMPFIVDDILINFDDDRSRATLEALAELAKRNQVILFTHHRQIIDEAQNLDDNETMVIHSL